jgi:acyl-coenzyme A thioesterase PaaI-like protein
LSGIVDWVGATAASTILDDNDINLSTVEMKIKYLLPAVANNDLYAEAEILSFSQNLIRVSIYIRQNEQIITEAKSLFVVMPIE